MADMKPKFTLRDLFWLVLVVGLSLGWWLDRSRFDEEQHKLLQWTDDETAQWLEQEASKGDESGAIRWLIFKWEQKQASPGHKIFEPEN